MVDPLKDHSFIPVASHKIESFARHYEVKLANCKHGSEREWLLFDLCNTLWQVVALKNRGKLSRTKDKKLSNAYYTTKKKLRGY